MFKTVHKLMPPPPLEHSGILDRILHDNAVAAALLLLSALLSFALANSPWPIAGAPVSEWFAWTWHLPLGVTLHELRFEKPLHLWINDGLMAVFFFVVGLEIKRELLVGELSSIRRAALPFAAALGGMVAPALIYAAINSTGAGAAGWGIPMATDIAFAAGVLGLFQGRVPRALAVFLLALAIVDDLGSVLVIVLFYTDSIEKTPLIAGLGLVSFSYVIGICGVRSSLAYVLLFGLIWLEFFHSGVHATVAGVLFAFTVPAHARYDTPLFISRIQVLLARFGAAEDFVHPRLVNEEQQRIVRNLEAECVHVEAPLQRIENKAHPYVAFIIMPLFAFANSGVHVDWHQAGALLMSPVLLGVFFGLVLGKQLGIMGACWIAIRTGIAELPGGVRWRQLYALSWLAGIGFTMSLFVAELAFTGHGGQPAQGVQLMEAKLGILLASLTAGIIGFLALHFASPPGNLAARTGDSIE